MSRVLSAPVRNNGEYCILFSTTIHSGTVALLASPGESTNIIFNALKDEFHIKAVVIEEPVERLELLRRRKQRLGLSTVVGQAVFQGIVVPYLRATSRSRMTEIKKQLGLKTDPIDQAKVMRVRSVNAEETRTILQQINPDVVVVSGTRIISKAVLSCIQGRFVNIHAGITPLYRGVHGAYWALVEGNKEACGVTVHLVDPGIDTGGILLQAPIQTKRKDNFSTYPILQIGVGVSLLRKALKDILDGTVDVKAPPAGKSRLWSHPTLAQYLRNRVACGVK